MVLPCSNLPHYVAQIQPTIEMLTTMDQQHPDILIEHGIVPQDYHQNLVFRSAVESIRGTYAANVGVSRESVVKATLESMKRSGIIADYGKGDRRYDVEVLVSEEPRLMAALEVKGGEGNSIQVSERSLWAQEFILWCHLDGSIGNSPGAGARSIMSRIAADIVRRGKLVDAALTRDRLCGTSTRPCPKYIGMIPPTLLGVAPDVFLFPRRRPTLDDPEPPVHDETTLSLPFRILDAYGVSKEDRKRHIWNVFIRVYEDHRGKQQHKMTITYLGDVVDTETV
ncbi:MAG: hypothetical protein ACYDAR_03340 [Thermomicrobiales bacterium]